MKPVLAVQVGDAKSLKAENGPDDQQAQGFGPEIIGGEIMNPGIDQKDMGGGFQG